MAQEADVSRKAKGRKTFDFRRYKQRHIALKIIYFGWNYDGLAEQASSDGTIEHHLVRALTKSCLIESRQQAKLNRCGRTDKGVSSYGQVINLIVRSNLIDEQQNVGLFTPDEYAGHKAEYRFKSQQVVELNYTDTLNNLLPNDIRVIAWTPIGLDFSARFNCHKRSYSYVFPMGDLCIESMNNAAEYLVGTHDFRNLCTFDLRNGVTNHVRTIYSAQVKPIARTISDMSSTRKEAAPTDSDPYTFYELVISGKGFLYHQIRCIMTVLFLVGRKKESAEVVRELLNLSKCPARPNYCPASPLPLTLFGCEYIGDDCSGWSYDQRSLFDTFRQLKRLWLRYKTKAVMIERVMFDVESLLHSTGDLDDLKKFDSHSWRDFGLEHDNMSDNKYVQLMNRPREDSLEKKLEHLESKKRLKRDSDLLMD